MKKKIALSLIIGCLASVIWGCSAKDVVQVVSREQETEETEETAVEEESVEMEEEESSEHPVLGDEDIADYEGFKYLYCEEIRTNSEKNEETGKMESKKLSVFIPEDDYVNVSTGWASSEKLGVTITIELEPYLRYNQEDYLACENMEYYLTEYEYDPYYSNDYKDLVVSEVEEIDEEIAYATAEYCHYNKYDDSYNVVFVTYYLAKLNNDVTVLVEVEVDSEDVTGKTPALIEELEVFYPFEIDWDKERAEAKLETYLENGDDNTVSTGYAIFELPEGWSEDTTQSDYDTYVYAPDGDFNFSGCYVSISREYIGYNAWDTDDKDVYMNEILAMIEESIQEEDIDAVASYYGETCLGTAVKMETASSEYGESAKAIVYWIFDDSYGYVVTAVQTENALDDAFAVAEDMLKNGQVR